MLRFQTTVAGLLAALLFVPVLVGQGQVTSLEDALTGTRRALEVLRGLEQRLAKDPGGVKSLILAATEAPSGAEVERDQRLEALRGEVSLLQMELDAAQSPMLAADGSVQSALGARLPLELAAAGGAQPLTTGLDDALRELLSVRTPARPGERPAASGPGRPGTTAPPTGVTPRPELGYSADPLRHGIAAYRAGRYAEAHELLATLASPSALYWRARTLERLERLDEAVELMEQAIALGGEGFEERHASTDLEFLRWKRDFLRNLPEPRKAAGSPR